MRLSWSTLYQLSAPEKKILQLAHKVLTYVHNASQGRFRRKITVLAPFSDVLNCKITGR